MSVNHSDLNLLFIFSGIRILIYGQAKTSWCETESHFEDGKHKSRDIFYSADEVYLDAKAYLLGMGDNGT